MALQYPTLCERHKATQNILKACIAIQIPEAWDDNRAVDTFFADSCLDQPFVGVLWYGDLGHFGSQLNLS
eukprot:5497757-Amphidinium_carterae.1